MKKSTSRLIAIAKMLNDGQYHDGTTIGEALTMTRGAVWKTIKKLEAYGIKINSIKGKGYALLEPLILFDPVIIKKGIKEKDIDIAVFESIDSTNTYLKSSSNKKRISICLAEQQTQGKGRLNRDWHSPFAQNIYFSCAYPFQKDVSELAGLSLVISLAIVKALQLYQPPKPILVKWPNDIVYEQQKLSGNLIEIQAESHGTCHAIIGIGINVNMMQDKNQVISQAWTSLRKITGQYIDRNLLCINLVNHLIDYLNMFEQKGLSAFIQEWNTIDALVNKDIALKNANNILYGKVKGIDLSGHLMLQLKNGDLQTFSAGDTSIVK
jgi:BirA family transcriptional regulator, biotin operon repressor / biotin---[acetyl-CoA-carboxylase] ligase